METISPWSHTYTQSEYCTLIFCVMNYAYIIGTIKFRSANFTRISDGLLRAMFDDAYVASMGSSFWHSFHRLLFQYNLQSCKCDVFYRI